MKFDVIKEMDIDESFLVELTGSVAMIDTSQRGVCDRVDQRPAQQMRNIFIMYIRGNK